MEYIQTELMDTFQVHFGELVDTYRVQLLKFGEDLQTTLVDFTSRVFTG